MAVRSISGPSSAISEASPQVATVSRKRGWTPSARPAIKGVGALSGVVLERVDAQARHVGLTDDAERDSLSC